MIPWLALGCTVTAQVGETCPLVTINEVMTANTSYEIPGNGSTSDWFELHNEGSTAADVSGFLLIGHSAVEPAFTIDEGFELAPDEYALFIAATYQNTGGTAPSVGFDFNDDSDSMQLRASDAADYVLCDSVSIPDQHQNFAWERDPDADPGDADAWCDASVPTPGWENEPCLCGATDAC